jgi:D-alanyl-D-alanine carboxypeptidase
MFEKMYGTEVEGLTILAGKTGFTNEAGYCLASYAEDKEGNKYICVTADSKGQKGAIYDTLNIYGTIADGYYNPTTEPVEETVTEQSGAGEQEAQQQEVQQQQYVEEPAYVEPAQPEPAEEQPAVQEEPQVQEEPVDNGGYEDAGVDGI